MKMVLFGANTYQQYYILVRTNDQFVNGGDTVGGHRDMNSAPLIGP